MPRPRLDLYEEAQPDHEARVLEHLGLVKRIALHLKVRVPQYIEVDELVQAGMIGLMEAARSYDPAKGVTFENFAHIRVRGAMIDEVRRMSYLPRSAVATNKTLSRSVHELSTRIGRQPTQAEIAEHLGKDMDSLQKERWEATLFETTSMETLEQFVENLPDDDDARPDIAVENAQFMEALAEAIERLPEREKLIIQLYYVEELNLKEIGKVVGVSESRVSQILSATAKSLRKTLQV